MQSETLAQEFVRLVKEYHEGDDHTKPEAWNLLADYAVDNADAISAALSAEQTQPVAVKASTNTMNEAAWAIVRRNGWEATARLSLHQATGLMVELAMQVSRGEVGCGYPDCGCCADAACEDAIKQHPDFRSANTAKGCADE